MTWFGTLDTWILLGVVWIVGAIVVSLLFSAMTQVEDRVARRRKDKQNDI